MTIICLQVIRCARWFQRFDGTISKRRLILTPSKTHLGVPVPITLKPLYSICICMYIYICMYVLCVFCLGANRFRGGQTSTAYVLEVAPARRGSWRVWDDKCCHSHRPRPQRTKPPSFQGAMKSISTIGLRGCLWKCVLLLGAFTTYFENGTNEKSQEPTPQTMCQRLAVVETCMSRLPDRNLQV